MANTMLKSLKFAQILNGRLSLRSAKYFPGQYIIRSYTSVRQGKSYATAAYKFAGEEESGTKRNDTNSMKDMESVDHALSRIDSLIRGNGRTQLKNIEQIFSAVNKEITTSTHALYLLRSCKYCYDEPPSKRIELVKQIWNRYQELGVEFDVRHYNALLDAHIVNGINFDPAELLASMEDLNIEPNKDTYMLVMKKYCQDGNISGASEIVEYMKEKQIPADENVFNYLIEGHIKNNDIAGALEMLDVMRSSNLEPTADTHSVLACGYAAIGNTDEMMSHLKQCKNVDSAEHYLKVIDVLAGLENHELIDEVLTLILDKERYQQEFVNSAVELIHKNKIEAAYKLSTASHSSYYVEGVNIFIKQLIKVEKEPSEVIKYCERVLKENRSKNIFMIAARVSIDYQKFDYVLPLLQKMQSRGHDMRPLSFSPLFVSAKKAGSPEGAYAILKVMCELGVPCDFKTYIEQVFPSMGVCHPKEILNKVKKSGQAFEAAADALFAYYCSLGELDYADQLTEIFPVMASNACNKELISLDNNISLEKRPTYLKVLRYMFMEQDFNQSDIQGKLLSELILRKTRLLEMLLNKYEDLSFSDSVLSVCRHEITQRNPQKLVYLQRLRLLSSERQNLFQHKTISVEDEDKYISHLQEKNMSCRSFLVKRIFHHIKEKNVARVQALLSLFDELEYDYTPLMLSNLVGLWSAAGDTEKAKEALEKLVAIFPNFKLDLGKSLDYVTLLIKYEKFDESYEALKNFLKLPYTYPYNDIVTRSIRNFTIALSSTQDVEFVKKMQSLIVPLTKEFGTKNALLDSTVLFYLLKNDLKSALDEFRSIIKNHRVPVCLNSFLKRCIAGNEMEILQNVIDLTTSCSGKSYALLELAVAFIENHNTQHAVKVIESLGTEIDFKVLDRVCEKLSSLNKLQELENLIFITKSLDHVNREQLYCHAFRACANRKDFERIAKLFETMKKEVIEPDSKTMKYLKDLFEKSNQAVPLSLIAKDQSEVNSIVTEATKPFIEYLESGNVEAALEELSGLKKGYIRTLSIKTLTDLVDLCVENNRGQNLAFNTQAMSYIIDNAKDVLKPILEKYAESGVVEKFVNISSFIPDFSLMSVNFNYHFSKAFISSGQYENLLLHLEEHFNKKNRLFSPVAFQELLKHPEYEDRVYNLAVKYLEESDLSTPMATVWAHYFSNENYKKADELYKKHCFNIDRVDSIVLKTIKKNESVSLAKEYVNFVKTTSLRPRLKERAYGAAIDLLVFKGMYDEAAELVVESEKQSLLLNKYYLSTLVTLKNALEKENKPVPFTLSLDVSSESNSDSE